MDQFFGRKSELGKLDRAYARVQRGESGAVLISGQAGSGKTALVTRFAVEAEQDGALFAYGKANAALQNTPFATVSAALNMLVKKAIAENPDNGDGLKETVRNHLNLDIDHNLAPLLVLVPALAYLFKDLRADTIQPEEADTQSSNLRLLSLLEAFTAALNRPLVLFLDDLQWMDAASHGFVRYLTISGRLAGLLLVMAHRHGAPEGSADLDQTTGMYKGLEATLLLPLAGLTKRDTRALLIRRLTPGQDLSPLAVLCHEKTAGNPLYLMRLLDELLEKGVIFKNNDEWAYNISHISRLGFTENVADLIIQRINHLEENCLALLKQAACIQGEISIQHLTATSGYPREKIEPLLWKPTRQGLLRNTRYGFAFTHDKILESVQALLDADEAREIHNRLVAFFLAKERQNDLEANIFTLLYHYGFCAPSITDPSFKKEMARIYYMAGKKAQRQSAYDLALAYFAEGKSHYPGDIWAENYDLALRFCQRLAKCAYLAGDFDTADRIFKEVDAQARCYCDRMPTELTKIPCYQAQHMEEKALITGLAMLRRLGINIPQSPSKPAIVMAILKAWVRFVFSRKARLKNKRLDPESDVYKAVQCLSALGAIVHYLSPERLLPLVTAKGFDLCVKYGSMEETPVFFMIFGMMLNEITGSIKWGRRLGAMAKQISMDFGNDRHKVKDLTLGNVFLDHWDKSLAQGISDFEEAGNFCLRQGDHEYFGYNALAALHGMLISGMPLGRVDEQIAEKKKVFKRINNQFALTTASLIQQAVANLVKGVPRPWVLDGDFFEEAQLDNSNSGFTTDFYLHKLYMAVYCGRMDKAAEIKMILGRCDQMAIIDSYQYNYFHFLSALVDIDLKKGTRKIRRHLKRLKKYASQNEAVYRSKYLLALAENLRFKNDFGAGAVYLDAAEAAKRYGFRFEQALAMEGLGKIAGKAGDESDAREHFTQAIGLYRQWGLRWKQDLFDDKMQADNKPEAVRSEQKASASDLLNGEASLETPAGDSSDEAHVDGILETLQRLSGAKVIHAAARVAQSWKSCVYIDGQGVHRPATFVSLPERMLSFACGANEVVRADGQSIESPFFDTEYFWKKRPASLMVVPAGKYRGLYFENCELSPHDADLIRQAQRLFARLDLPHTEDHQISGVQKPDATVHKQNCERVQSYMVEQEAFKNPKLTLAGLAREVKLSQRAITDAINTRLGQNFRTFVNSYRVEAVKKAFGDPLNGRKTVLEIALDQGFNSKSTFNDVFKQFVGTTPSDFLTGMAEKNGSDSKQLS